ncbi:MAG: LuxR C-terminal-related transcriptional regulator [Nocardioides sp.]
MSGSPVRVAVLGANEIIRLGLAAAAAQNPHRLVLVPFEVDGSDEEPDVVIYDAIALHQRDAVELDVLVKEMAAAVVVLARDLRPDLAARAVARGADGVVSLEAPVDDLIAVVEAAASGVLEGGFTSQGDVGGTYQRLGEAEGLTPREVEMLGYIALGLRNTEIAEHCYLSINSVKTYIRGAYRKIGVTHRSQAVQWCLQHGFAPRDEGTRGD